MNIRVEGQVHIHESQSPGLTMGETRAKEILNAHGQHYWKATAQIGSMFGQEVGGEIEGIGRSREEALERLELERKNLYDSLWE